MFIVSFRYPAQILFLTIYIVLFLETMQNIDMFKIDFRLKFSFYVFLSLNL